jgi:phage terminase large subunit-like protein
LRDRIKPLTRGERVIAFIQRYCYTPEGRHVGKPLRLMEFQKRFILDIYDNPAGTARAYLSIARKNGKTVLIAAIVLAHVVGPESRLNSQIISGARSREQAALVFSAAEKMVRLNPDLAKIVKVIPSTKRLVGLTMNVEYRAISAEAGTAHGLSPVVAILDEVGQVKGPKDAFVEAITTAQGAHDDPLLLAISTQAATDGDLFSTWLDDAEKSKDPRIVCHLYTAPDGCDIQDRAAWKAANPAMGEFRSLQDLADFATIADRNPADENSFRWLFLNQRIEANSPFVSKNVWKSCAAQPSDLVGVPVYGGLDLSEVNDLTACVFVGRDAGVLNVKPTFWLPGDGLAEKSRSDRVPYDVWKREGFLNAVPGRTVDYEFVACWLYSQFEKYDIRKIAFDRWNWRHFKPWLLAAGFTEEKLEAHFVGFGQGFQSMSPALRDLEAELLNGKLAHGGHPLLSMCAANAVVQSDPAGNRKLSKSKSTGRIDGMVALAMAIGVMPEVDDPDAVNLLTSEKILARSGALF